MGMESGLSCWAPLRVAESGSPSCPDPKREEPKKSSTITPHLSAVIPTGIRGSTSQHVLRHRDPGTRQEGLETAPWPAPCGELACWLPTGPDC